MLPKVCALAFAFSTAHIQRAALHSSQRCTVRSVVQCASLCTSPLQRCTARSIAQRPALHCTEHSEPRQGRSQQANQAYTARSATQCPALHSAQRYTALHSAQRFTAPSVAQCRAAVRSGSREGYLDFAVNARRINALAKALGERPGWTTTQITKATNLAYFIKNMS